MADQNLNVLLDQRSNAQKELLKADIEADEIREELQQNPIWWKQDKLNELIKKVQKFRNIIFGIDALLDKSFKQQVAA